MLVIRTRWRAVALAVGLSVSGFGANAQADPARLDTTHLTTNARAVYRTWQAYLASRVGRFSATARTPSPYWSAAEQTRWPVYDLADFYLDDAAVPEIVAVEPVREGARDAYRITTRFHTGNQASRSATWWTAMTVTVFAAREGGAWKLSNALPRLTAKWHRDTVGPITYVYAPDYPYDHARAKRAVAFTDSLAAAFGVPTLAPLTYFLTPTVDEVYRIMGLESDVKFGPTGGAAQPVNRMLFSGNPALGEEYRHELVHLVLAPLVTGNTSYLVSEGVPTWIGGTAGATFSASVRSLADFLKQRPTVSLDAIMSGSFSNAQFYPAGAVLVDMVFRQGGVAAVKELFNSDGRGGDTKSIVARLLKRPWPDVARIWRARVMTYS
ncbi:MAG: hypothetical protein IPP90_06150 [Gemmatimonadaceae bacterium]|nr:hypothetical protein [Gemmatimonadaceae bacterium]